MRKLRDVLRPRQTAGLSIRDISRSTKLSVCGIQKLLSRAQTLHLSWPLPADLDDTRLAQLFYPGVSAGVKLPTYAELKFPSLWMVAGHYNLPNFTPLRMLSVWFQPTEVSVVITWERLFMLHELHAQKAYLQARLAQYPGLSGARLLREIQAQGYTGGYTILTDYLRTIRPPQEAGYEVRFETPAGHQGRFGRDNMDQTSCCVSTEQGSLGTTQDLNTLNIKETESDTCQVTVINLIRIDSHGGFLVVGEIKLTGTTDGKGCRPSSHVRHHQSGCLVIKLCRAGHSQSFQLLTRESGYRDSDIGQVLLTLLRSNEYFFENLGICLKTKYQ